MQRHFDAGGDVVLIPGARITIREAVQPSGGAVASEGGFAEVPVGGDRVALHRAAVTKRRRASRWIHIAPELDLDIVVPGRMYLLEGGIRPREINTVLLETWLLRDLAQHPLTFVRRCEVCWFSYDS